MNTFFSKILNFFRLDYPIKILPRTYFVKSINLDEIFARHDLIIVRRSDLPINKSFNSLNKLRSEAIDQKRIPNLSMNMLGGIFKPHHINFIIRKPGSNLWEGDKIKFSDYKNSYEKIPKSDPIFLNSKFIHNIRVPFKAENNSQNRKRAKLPFEPNSSNELKLSGLAKLIHSPTNLNYWHVELIVTDFNEHQIKRIDGEFNSSACIFIHDIISESANFVNPNPNLKLKREFYTIQ